jgi:hypothetical protein
MIAISTKIAAIQPAIEIQVCKNTDVPDTRSKIGQQKSSATARHALATGTTTSIQRSDPMSLGASQTSHALTAMMITGVKVGAIHVVKREDDRSGFFSIGR